MKKKLLTLSFCAAFVLASYEAATYSGGPPDGNTDAPGDGNCTSCHGGVVNSGTALNNITLSTSTSLSSLMPSTTYTFTLSFSEAGRTRYGFQLCVLPSGAGTSSGSVGTLTATSSETFTSTTGNRTYLMHGPSGTAAPSSSRSWQFSYTTPAAITTPPVFYVAVNSSNNDNTNGGDLIYTRSFSSTILPVKWGDIAVERKSSLHNITWTTETEINNSHFEVERSADAYRWELAGTVKGAGNSMVTKKYALEAAGSEAVFYRVKQVDFNGVGSYSKTVGLTRELEDRIQPMYHIASRSVVLPGLGWENLTLTGMDGSRLEASPDAVNGHASIDMHSHKPGIYILSGELNGRHHTWKVFAY